MTNFNNSARYRVLQDLRKDSVELSLLYCGWESCSPKHRYGPNKRDTYVLHVVISGRGTLKIYNKKYHLQSGDAFLIPKGTEAWYEADEEDPWVYMWVGFIGIKSEDYLRSAGFTEDCVVRKVSCIEKLQGYIDSVLESHQLTQANELKRNALLLLFLAALMEEYRKRSPFSTKRQMYPGSAYVKYAMEYIQLNYSHKIMINELAEYIGINRSYLTKCFKKVVGYSPQEYLLNFRMEKAKGQLATTNLPIHKIAETVGYTDQLAFSKIFKSYYGICPKKYREKGEGIVLQTKLEQVELERI